MTGQSDAARATVNAPLAPGHADAAGLSALLSHLHGHWGPAALEAGLAAVACWAGASFGAACRTRGAICFWQVASAERQAELAGDIEGSMGAPVGCPGVVVSLLPGGGWAVTVPLIGADDEIGKMILGFEDHPAGDRGFETTLLVMGRLLAYAVAAGDPPAGQLVPEAESAGDPEDARQAVAGRHILVVEDDQEIAASLCSVLADEGYDVLAVNRGEAALSQVRTARPDLLILDVRLPGIDGFGVAEEVARDRQDEPIPVLFLSASNDLPSRVRDLQSGSTDYLRKPFTERDLLARVEQSLLRSDASRRLRESARLDGLTGLGNSRLFEERLKIEGSRMERYQTPLTIAVFDLDKLKAINDRHGHAAGSQVLRAVGQTLKQEIRETDAAARYGGDEFVVLLPHTDLPSGVAFSERVLDKIRRLEPGGIPISVSGGVACFDRGLDASVEDLFSRADAASYRAKRAGGNRIAVDWGRTGAWNGLSQEPPRPPPATRPATLSEAFEEGISTPGEDADARSPRQDSRQR